MGVKVTVRMGGAGGATTVDYSSQVPVFTEDGDPNITAAQGFIHGQQFEFTVIDDIGEIPKADLTKNLPAHSVVHVIEDAPGFDCWIGRGRIATKGWGREDHPWGDSRTSRVKVEDQNTDLKGLVLTSAWVRPAESGRARILALITAFLSGSPRVTTDVENHLVAAGGEVTMPAKTYPAGTDLPEIVRDCAEIEGKDASIVIHHDGGSHLCFFYADEENYTVYPCAASISDDPAEIDPDHVSAPVFAPIWDQGDASIEEGQDKPISHLVNKYGSGDDSFVVSANSSRVTSYDYWAIANNDSLSESATQALARADALVASNGREHVTHQATVWCKASQVDYFCAGMSIDIKSAASMGGQYLGTTQTRRIASVKFEPVGPEVGAVEGAYAVHMQLDRPLKLIAATRGPVGPKPPSGATPASCTLDAGQMTLLSTPNGGFETGTTTNWTFGQLSGAVQGPATGDWEGSYYYQINGAGFIRIDPWTGLTFTAGQNYVVRFRHANLAGTGAVHFGIAGGDETVQDGYASDLSWEEGCIEWTPVSTTAGANVHFGIAAIGALDNFSLDDVRLYTGGTGDTTEPIGDDGSADPGDNTDVPAPINHVHEHGKLSPSATHHHGTAQIEGYSSGVTDHGALTGLADDDHPQYLLTTEGEQGKVQAHGAMGATETFDPTDGNLHTGTLDANCTFTLNAPPATRNGSASYAIIELAITGSGTNTWTWPGAVEWAGTVPDPPADGELSRVILETWDGGTTWYGAAVGAAATSSALWVPVTTYDGTNWMLAVDGDGNAIMTEAP